MPDAPIFEPTERQQQAMRGVERYDELGYGGALGGGKLLALDTLVPTPSGWTTVGAIKIGDMLFGRDGQPCAVTYLSPINDAPKTYRLTMDDQSEFVCCADHLWFTVSKKERVAIRRRSEEFRARRRADRPSRATGKSTDARLSFMSEHNAAVGQKNRLQKPTGSVRTTQEIVDSLIYNGVECNHAIPVADPWHLDHKELPIDPYVLGAWLGDGTSRSGQFTSADSETVERFNDYKPRKLSSTNSGKAFSYGTRGLQVKLRSIGVLGNKHIPQEYLRASAEQRMELLRGLMDTDGCCSPPGGSCEFCNTNEALASGVFELAISLGIKAAFFKKRATLYGVDKGPKYIVCFTTSKPVFSLQRKLDSLPKKERGTQKYRMICKAEAIDPVPMRCIQVANADHLFLVGKAGVPTHNTVFLCWYAHTMSTLYPGNRGAIFRENLKDLRETTLEEFKIFMARYYPHQPISWRYSPTIECELTCAGGQKSVILWLETKEPEKHLSLNLGWAGFDEASQVSRDAYLVVSGRVGRHLLQDGTRPPCKIAWGSNPGPSWCKQDFPVGSEPARVQKHLDNGSVHTLAFVPALHSDNPHLPKDYIPKLRARYPQIWIDRFLRGSWDVFEGQIYTEFDPLRHVYGPSSADQRVHIPTSLRNTVTMDWGQRVPSACLLVSLDREGEFWIMREYRAAHRTPAQHAPHIRLLSEGVEVDKWVFDYAAVDQSSGVKIWQMFRDLDPPIPFKACGKKNKTGADNTVLFLKQLMLDDRLHIHESCAGLIYEITNAKWKPQSATMAAVETPKDEPLDIDDHSLDALFMALEEYRRVPGKPTMEGARAADRARQVRRHIEESENVIPDPEQIDYAGRIAPRRVSNPWAM